MPPCQWKSGCRNPSSESVAFGINAFAHLCQEHFRVLEEKVALTGFQRGLVL